MKKILIATALAASLVAATGAQAQTATNPATVEQATASSAASGLLVPLLAAIIVLAVATSTTGGEKIAIGLPIPPS